MTQNQLSTPNSATAETKTVSIRGILCTLERRICEGGCERDFWVIPGSPAVHARSDCKFTCNIPIDQIPAHILQKFDHVSDFRESLDMEKQAYAKQLFSKTNPKTKPKKPEKPKLIPKDESPEFLRQMRRWNIAVSRARRLYSNKEKLPGFREGIADIACAVITNKKKFSIKFFSILIGLDRKTLQSWIHIKTDVINKIGNYNGNFLAARKARDTMRGAPDTDFDLDELFNQECDRCKKKKAPALPLPSNVMQLIKKEFNGSSTIAICGQRKTFQLKIKIRSAS